MIDTNQVVSKCLDELSFFFNTEAPGFKINYVYSRSEYDKICGFKTESWMSAHAERNGNIYIFHPSVFEVETCHKLEGFQKTLYHEICHLFYFKKVGCNRPKWLNEGLACFLAGQIKNTPNIEEALEVFKYYKNSDKHIYNIGFYWVNLLIDRFGKQKMIDLLNLIAPASNEDDFNKSFETIYNTPFTKEGLFGLVKK